MTLSPDTYSFLICMVGVAIVILFAWLTVIYMDRVSARFSLTVVFGGEATYVCREDTFAFLGRLSNSVFNGKDRLVLIEGDDAIPVGPESMHIALTKEELAAVRLERLFEKYLRNPPGTICVVRDKRRAEKARVMLENPLLR